MPGCAVQRPWGGKGRWLSPEGQSFSGVWQLGRPHTGEGAYRPVMHGGWRCALPTGAPTAAWVCVCVCFLPGAGVLII